jgi:hypothetical protein
LAVHAAVMPGDDSASRGSTVVEAAKVRGGGGRKQSSAKKKATYNLFTLLDACLDLWNVTGRVVVEELLDLILAEQGEVLLGRQLALAEAHARRALGHDCVCALR